jgi:hypothetical protein
MNKKQLAACLQYPAVWLESGLLTDELFNLQAPEYQKEYGSRVPDGGTEHWRYGAFNFILKRGPDQKTLELLLDAAIADPDMPMAGAAIRDVIAHPLSTRAMLDKALAVVSTSRDYHVSPVKLERGFVERSNVAI